MLVLGLLKANEADEEGGSGEHVSPSYGLHWFFSKSLGLVAVTTANCLVLPSSRRRCKPVKFLNFC